MTAAVQLAQSVAPGVSLGFKNRLINGSMMIDQRNAGASVTITNTAAITYTLDRYYAYGSQASKFSVQQNAGSVTPPTGFINYLGVTSASSYASLSTDEFLIAQRIEGLNIADLSWGTNNAKTITLSFQVYSSLTGTFGGSIVNSAGNRCYVFSYAIASSNTWTSISVTIPGDTTGTWLTTNGTGMRVIFDIGSGSANRTTAGSWGSTGYDGVTGGVQVTATSGATFYITGVQLEVGTTATPFEFRDYGRELLMCQRYYEVGGIPSVSIQFSGNVTSGNLYFATIPFIVTKRASPTVTNTDSNSSSFPAGASTVGYVSATEVRNQRTANATARGYFGDSWTASAEL